MWIIVALGNIGMKYKNTRHNAGFILADEIKTEMTNIKKLKLKKSDAFSGLLMGEEIVLAYPNTFMNLSGSACRELIKKYGKNIIVISDDVYLPVGTSRLRMSGSAGGHNGIQDIIDELGTDEFPRIKIGVGEREGEEILRDHVLSKFKPDEKRQIKALKADILDKIKQVIDESK